MSVPAVRPVDSIAIPAEYLELCSQWYCGQNDMLYAVASTGGLTLGSIRPPGCETDEKWYLTIWQNFAVDVMYATRMAEGNGNRPPHDDLPALRRMEEWADSIVEQATAEYGLENWERE